MNSRQKGARREPELAAELRKCGYDDARRGQQYCGANGDADVVGLPGVHIECKRVESLNIDKALEQSIQDSKATEIPTVIHRKNGKPWKVTLLLDDFLKIYGGKNEGYINRHR